jgi:hypothetical protein
VVAAEEAPVVQEVSVVAAQEVSGQVAL